jgi:hypothetical protein
MKASLFFLAVSALLSSAAAGVHERRHAHENFHRLRRQDSVDSSSANVSCGCTTIYTTYYGEASRTFAPRVGSDWFW